MGGSTCSVEGSCGSFPRSGVNVRPLIHEQGTCLGMSVSCSIMQRRVVAQIPLIGVPLADNQELLHAWQVSARTRAPYAALKVKLVQRLLHRLQTPRQTGRKTHCSSDKPGAAKDAFLALTRHKKGHLRAGAADAVAVPVVPCSAPFQLPWPRLERPRWPGGTRSRNSRAYRMFLLVEERRGRFRHRGVMRCHQPGRSSAGAFRTAALEREEAEHAGLVEVTLLAVQALRSCAVDAVPSSLWNLTSSPLAPA
jgi:hypothetical protein